MNRTVAPFTTISDIYDWGSLGWFVCREELLLVTVSGSRFTAPRLFAGAMVDCSPVFQGRDHTDPPSFFVLLRHRERRLSAVFMRRSRDADELPGFFPGLERPGYRQPSLRDEENKQKIMNRDPKSLFMILSD